MAASRPLPLAILGGRVLRTIGRADLLWLRRESHVAVGFARSDWRASVDDILFDFEHFGRPIEFSGDVRAHLARGDRIRIPGGAA